MKILISKNVMKKPNGLRIMVWNIIWKFDDDPSYLLNQKEVGYEKFNRAFDSL
jgi:hypothetical protein